MSKAKNYIPKMSLEPTGDGRFDITADALPTDKIDFSQALERQLVAEEFFLKDVTEAIETRLQLKKSLRKEGTLATIALYETPLGDLVEIARDQAYGIMVESVDKKTLERIFLELQGSLKNPLR